jgi:hypothetical protein
VPRYRIVIDDAEKAHEQQVARSAEFHTRASGQPRGKVERQVREHIGAARPTGTVHDVASDECPEGLVNCRNCGDPEHAETCSAAGHCPDCGTKHGIAPDRIVAANGYRLERE